MRVSANTLTVLTLSSCLLAACGDSDLPPLQEAQVEAARNAPLDQETSATAGSNGTGNETANQTDGGNGSSTVTPDNSGTGSQTGSGTGSGTGSEGNNATAGGTTPIGAAQPGTDGSNTGTQGTGTDGSGTQGTGTQGTGTQGTGTGETPAAAAASGFDLSNYNLVFNDEFNGTDIDTRKWKTALPWGPDFVVNDELQYYVDTIGKPEFGYNPFSFDGEALTINAMKTPENLRANANEQGWLSGALSSENLFDMTFGYVEMRADLPPGQGLWPAFWMLSSEFTELKPQLFIMEYNGGKPDSVFHNYNFEDADGNLRSPGQLEVVVPGISEGYHTFGVEWTPTEFTYYVDGTPRYKVNGESVSQQDMHLIVNLAIGGLWAGAPDGTTPEPASYRIDYVRAYQLRN